MDYSFDVEIYRQIRQDPSKREILLRGLRNHRRRCVKQLLDHPTFAAAFDTLLDIPCLRDGIRLTTIHKHFSWKCDEVELLSYINKMKSQWLNDIAGGNVELLQMFRSEDVATLEGKCPSLIRKDYEFIFDEILAGRLFKNIDSESLSGVQERLFSIDSTILSFGTFLRDANILECYASCLLHVLPSKRDCTITSQLWKAFQPADHNYEFIADLPSYDSNDTAFTKARQ
ncbi:unnamed protein product, partial [Clonostachys chloroleuca]